MITNCTPFEAYCLYTGLKLHFTSSYDYFKYHGKSKTISEQNFEKHKTKYSFNKLAKKEDVIGFLVSNFLVDKDIWIKKLVDDNVCNVIYRKWAGIQESLTYHFTKDLQQLNSDFNYNFQIMNSDIPFIVLLFLRKKISLETLTILSYTCNIVETWNSKIQDLLIWPEVRDLMGNYHPFLAYDKKKFKDIVIQTFKGENDGRFCKAQSQ